MNCCLATASFGLFSRSRANRVAVCSSITTQNNAPKMASPINPPRPIHIEVDKATIIYIKVGNPNPNESTLFHRTVKKFSFVILFVLVINDGHLPFPLLPNVIFGNQISHKVTDIDATDLPCIKNRATGGRWMDFIRRNITLIN